MLARSIVLSALLSTSWSVGVHAENHEPRSGSSLSTAQVAFGEDGQSPTQITFRPGSQPTVQAFLDEYRGFFSMSDANQLKVVRVSSDRIGTHHRLNQYYKGVEVIGAQFILHEKNGTIRSANGHMVSDLNVNVVPAISEQAALEAALRHVGAVQYMWQSPSNEAFIQREQKNPSASFRPSGELKLTSGRAELASANIKLVYRFDIYARKPLGRYYVDVDAMTGEIVNQINRIHHADVPGKSATLYNGTVPITVDRISATAFRLQEHTVRTADIETYDVRADTTYDNTVDFASGTATGPWDKAGASVHWGTEATFDYFRNAYGRNSVDDAGFALKSYVHFAEGFVNAFWDGTRMTYGDGDGVDFGPVISLDVIAHELTHGVTEFSSNLIYQAESGALNESFSDIFGNAVEFQKEGAPGIGSGDWRIGEDIDLNPADGRGFRNMANPNADQLPDTYKGTYWISTDPPYNDDNDQGGVHGNSAVQNFWFYLLATGGSGTNDHGDAYKVTGIGVTDAAAIAYFNNNAFLTPGATYVDARIGAIAAAEDLFGVGSRQAVATAAAWDAVGVRSNLVKNASFELSGIRGWDPYNGSSLARSSTAHTGSYGLRVRGPARLGEFGINDHPNWAMGLQAGDVVRFRAWVRGSGSPGRSRLRVREYVSGVRVGGSNYSRVAALDPTWKQLSLDYTVRRNGASLDLQILLDPKASGATFYVDDVSIEVEHDAGTLAMAEPETPAIDGPRLGTAFAVSIAPNPSRGDAMISMVTTRPGKLNARLYDLAGRVVRTLTDESNSAAGRHEARIARGGVGRGLNPGVYFYRVEAAEGVARGRFVILE